MWLECLIVGSLLYLAKLYTQYDEKAKAGMSDVDMSLQPIRSTDFLMGDSKEVPMKSTSWWGTTNDVAEMQNEDTYMKNVKTGTDGQFIGDFGSANSRFFDRVNKDM